MDRIGDTLYVVRLPDDSEARNPYFIRALDASGRILARGCRRSDEYSKSLARRGIVRSFGFADVAAGAGRVYCVQPISPIVQVLTPSARLAETIRLAPPFYVPPHDIPNTTNSQTILAFETTFTAQRRVFARANGFLSVYERADPATKRAVYRLFGCVHVARARLACAVGTSPGEPIRLVGGDTLVVVEEASDAKGPDLAFYRIR